MGTDKCANCGAPTSGGKINGRPFCNDKKCIDAVMAKAFVALAALRERVSIEKEAEG